MPIACWKSCLSSLALYISHQKFIRFTDVTGSIFFVTIQTITGEVDPIPANFDAGISCSSTFMPEGIVCDIVNEKLE